MKKENRVYAFLVSKYGAKEADKAMINFADKQKKYVEKPKQ